jgi:hypothetical protein
MINLSLPLMKLFILSLVSLNLIACIGSKPIANREIVVEKPRNNLEFGNNWNNLDVSKAMVIKRIKHRRADFFYDK